MDEYDFADGEAYGEYGGTDQYRAKPRPQPTT